MKRIPALVSVARCETPGADGWLAPASSSAVGVPRSLVSFARCETPGADGWLAPPSSSAVGVPRSLVRLLSLVALLGVASEAVAQPAQPTAQELANNPAVFLQSARKLLKWDEPAVPTKIVGPIYFVGTKGLSVYLLTTAEGHILLNTGMPGSGPLIEASIRKLGFKPEDIKLLLVGHAHIDHAGGHAYLQKLSGAKIAVIREEKALFESGGKLDFHYGAYKEFEFEPAKVDQVFDHGDKIKLGNLSITALLSSGHTRGSTTFVTDVEDGGQTYKVVFPSSASINPGYRLGKNPSYPGIEDDYRRTLQVLESLKPNIWLALHNESFDFETKRTRAAQTGVKAWVDPDGYQKWVATQREKFTATTDRQE